MWAEKRNGYLRELLPLLEELGIARVEAKFSGRDGYASLEYMDAINLTRRHTSLPKGLEESLKETFLSFLLGKLEADFEYSGGYGKVVLDLEEGFLEASFSFYGEQEVEERSFPIKEVAKQIAWEGRVPNSLSKRKGETFFYDGHGWYPWPPESETRVFLLRLAKVVQSLGLEQEGLEGIEAGRGKVSFFFQGEQPVIETREVSLPLERVLFDELMEELA